MGRRTENREREGRGQGSDTGRPWQVEMPDVPSDREQTHSGELSGVRAVARQEQVAMNKHEIKPGQRLWYVPRDSRDAPHWITVTSVRRKWATFDFRRRMDLESLTVDGGAYCSPGRCWLSEEAYRAHIAKCASWVNLREWMRGNAIPEWITLEQIQQAAKLLGMEVSE
jgi:hypothetical protein